MQPSATTSATYGTFIQLNGLRDDSSAVFRRAVDAVRREWTLEPVVEEPLGVYFDGEELVFHDPDGIFDDLPIQSDLYGRSVDPSGTESVCQPDHPSSDTEATSDDSDGSVDDEFDDFRVVYEGGPTNGAFLQMPSIRDILKYARSGYLREFYTLQVTVTQYKETFKDGVDHTVFNLELDTGSNTTWLRGENVAEIIPPPRPSDRSSGGEPTEFKIKKISHRDLGNRSRIFDHGIEIPRIPDGQTTTITSWQGRVRYGLSDHRSVVVLGIPENMDPTRICLPGAWNWGTEGRWRVRLPVEFTPAIAICGSPRLLVESLMDGILGLGTASYQTAFKHHIHAHREEQIPSFAVALEKQLKAIEDDPGVIFYFMLRPPSDMEDVLPAPSYIGLQRWPCDSQPRWSPKIDIDSHSDQWLATLVRLRVWVDIEPTSADPASIAHHCASCDVAIDPQWRFSMDTGVSSSYAPKCAMAAIRALDFISSRPTDPFEQYTGAPYYAPRAFWQKNDVTVELTFQNTDQTTVSVYVPALGFLYNTRGEGLVWESPSADANAGSGVLGLNLFQAVYAAFHLPTSTSNEAPHIRLAPQTRADTSAGLYNVPPLQKGR